ncbi:hypothetical protein [Sulfitobacter sp.]|uniref:hypothetical protein n=1 Tax=Sulfitobacter sp. TaxID=1903071 RepID=UPI003F6B3E57
MKLLLAVIRRVSVQFFLLALLLAMYGFAAAAADVRIEGDRLGINVGNQRGFGVMAALKRNGLIRAERMRGVRYQRDLKRLSRRMQGAEVLVGNHKGGYLYGTIADVKDINALSLPVRITGNYCLSSCTLFLGAHKVCVSQTTRFGFHKPGNYVGLKYLSPEVVWRAIRHVEEYYNAPLSAWWQSTGSKSSTLNYLSGLELIRMGYKACRK